MFLLDLIIGSVRPCATFCQKFDYYRSGMILVILSVFSACCRAVLLDSQTQSPPTRALLLTDDHFNLVMGLYNDELQSRIQLENYVKQLEQGFVRTKQDVTTNVLSKFNATLNTLSKDIVILNENYETWKSQIPKDLMRQYMERNSTNFRLHGEVVTFSEMIESRFPEFTIAVHALEQNLYNLSLKAQILEHGQNMTITALDRKVSNLQQQLTQMSNRVAMTVCIVNDTDFVNEQVIKFNEIRIKNGIKNPETLTNTGMFTCERTGLYLISAFIQTATHSTGFQIMKNNERIATGFVSNNIGYQTITSIVIEHLSVNDKVYVNAYGSTIKVKGYRESCFTVFQVL